MSNHTLSHETREEFGNIKAYVSGENEAGSICIKFPGRLDHADPDYHARRNSRRIASSEWCRR
jgi:hypothetical protein